MSKFTQGARIDHTLCWAIGLLLAFGLVMMYSSSIAYWESARAAKSGMIHTHFLLRQSISLIIGLILAYGVFHIRMENWNLWAGKLFLFTLIALMIVLIPFIGKKVGGAQRWIPLGVISFQPSELAKFTVLLYAANYMTRQIKKDVEGELNKIQMFWRIAWPLYTVVAFTGILLLAEPDMGAFFLISIIATGIFFLSGVNLYMNFLIVLALLSACAFIIFNSEFRMQRFRGFFTPWKEEYATGVAYQTTQALIAFGRGGLWGKGLGNSVEKLNWLPEAHTDFLCAIIGEELGVVVVGALIVIFFWVTYRIMSIGRKAIDLDCIFSGLVAQGVGLWIGIQSLIHLGVNVKAIPIKGLTLPFMSYGGSALCINLIALAVVLRIEQDNQQLLHGGDVR